MNPKIEILPLPKSLPSQLHPTTESSLLEMFGTDKEETAKAILIEHNLRLVIKIVRNFIYSSAAVEDLISVGTIGLIKAINTFNADEKVKLASHVSRCVKKEIQTYLKCNNHNP